MSTKPTKKMTVDAEGKTQVIAIETPASVRRASVFEDDDENAFSDVFLLEGEKIYVRELSNDAVNRYRADEAAVVALAEIASDSNADFGALRDQARSMLERSAQGGHYLAQIDAKIATAANDEQTPALADTEQFAMMSTALKRAYAVRAIQSGVVDWELTSGNGKPVPYSIDNVLRISAKVQFELCERLVHYSVFGQDLADFLP